MKNHIGRMILLVDDYEKAAAFYETNFGFTRIFDVTTDVGQRFLHIGTEQAETLGIWFLKADRKEQKERIGNQTCGQPTMVIYTTAFDELYKRLKSNKVTIKAEPVLTPGYNFLHCLDLYGNEIVVVELREKG
jgi:predicted enzyme related to lactoylglutathione lyase